MSNFIKGVLADNGLLDGDYAEVYAGGAAIAWPLLFEEYVHHVHINDLNASVFAFWRSVLEHTEGLCRLIRDTRVTMREWRRQKAVQANPHNHSVLELAFSTFYLNRTNRSGILKGGVIGGKAQNGGWKLDARYNKPDLIARIERIARYRERISVYNDDAARFIGNTLPKLPRRTLVYLDPPYYGRGAGLYENHYEHNDHVDIARLISSSDREFWIVSYDAAPEISQLYKNYRSVRYDLSYSAQKRYSGSEMIFFSDKIRLGHTAHPIRVADVIAPQQKTRRGVAQFHRPVAQFSGG